MHAISSVIQFQFENHRVRTMLIDDQPWFCAADVCASLAIGNTSLAVNGRADRNGDGLDEDEKGIATVNTSSGEQQMLVINESGLYALIFKSRKKEAKRFQKWVTAEVLPAIRRTGQYQDSNNKMATLVDALIGMTEVNVLKGLIRDKAKVIPIERRRSFQHTMHNRLHTRFNVPRLELIPEQQFEAACNFIAAYALEGEWLPKEEKPGTFVLDQYAAQYVNSLVHYAYWVNYRWEQGISSAVKALNPKFHSKTWEFFQELQRCARQIERHAPDLMEHFRDRKGGGLRPQDCIATGHPVGHPAD